MRPPRPTHVQGTVTSNNSLSPDVKHITIKAQGRLAFKAGQFCWITYEKEGEKYKRPYSIASANWEEELTLCIKAVAGGKVSPTLCELQEGEDVDVFSPLGVFVLPPEEEEIEEYVFISTGTGVAPFRSMLRELYEKSYNNSGADTNKKVTLLAGYRNEKDVLYDEEFTKLANTHQQRLKYLVTISREEREGRLKGRVQEHLENIKNSARTKYYICGINEMVLDVKKRLLEKGVMARDIHAELYG